VSEVVVSIIVPVYNRAGLVANAIDSALRAGAHFEVEVIVVDDRSTDGTWATLKAYEDPRVHRVQLDQNRGQSAARNAGLELARGRFVKFLDSDDVLFDGHLDEEVRALEAGADIAVSGWFSETDDGTTVAYEAPVFMSIVDDILAGRAVPTSAALYRRRSEWRWDPSLRKLDDWDYFCHAALGADRIVTVPGPAYVVRTHGGARATDVSMLINAREHHQILKKMEDRLGKEGRLTPARRRRLAQYYYKELRVLCLHDASAFEAALRHIVTLDPGFQPRDEERQRWMRVLARILGVRATLRLHSAIKRTVGAFLHARERSRAS
jgi:glycosyltransferase involved in cell wall biosynthesis